MVPGIGVTSGFSPLECRQKEVLGLGLGKPVLEPRHMVVALCEAATYDQRCLSTDRTALVVAIFRQPGPARPGFVVFG